MFLEQIQISPTCGNHSIRKKYAWYTKKWINDLGRAGYKSLFWIFARFTKYRYSQNIDILVHGFCSKLSPGQNNADCNLEWIFLGESIWIWLKNIESTEKFKWWYITADSGSGWPQGNRGQSLSLVIMVMSLVLKRIWAAVCSLICSMTTSSNRSIFHVTGPLCPSQRPVTRSFDVFFDLRPNKVWINKCDAGHSRGHRAHYEVPIMLPMGLYKRNGGICDIYIYVTREMKPV